MNKVRSLVIVTMVAAGSCVSAVAQVATPATSPRTSQTSPKPGKAPASRPTSVLVENRQSAPQVVTVLHRLNGLKMVRLLLLRSNEDVKAISKLDKAFSMTQDVHTNVIAGLSLDDGQTIVAWLPDAEVEMGPLPAPFATTAPTASTSTRVFTPAPQWPLAGGPTTLFERPDLTVIARDGQRWIARYVGLDGGTGLSVLKLANKTLSPAADANEQSVAIGQHMRLLAPEPVARPQAPVSGTTFARIGEAEGEVVGISRTPSGAIARLRIKSEKLSPANIGGVVINDAGATVGIIDAVENNEATVMPSSLVRTAAQRVLKRQSSVPRPWLGVRGEPIENLQLEQVLVRGWRPEGAKSLTQSGRGIMLTSVVPGSPAAKAALRTGDVILGVDDEFIKSSDELSWVLEEVGPGAAVQFTVARPDRPQPETVNLTLSEFPNQFYQLKWSATEFPTPRVDQFFTRPFSGTLISSTLVAHGIEAVALMPPVASTFGARGGLLVIDVYPATAAFKAGLRPGDVIEKIDGHEVSSPVVVDTLKTKPQASYSFSVVRNRERVVVKVEPTGTPR